MWFTNHDALCFCVLLIPCMSVFNDDLLDLREGCGAFA